MSRAQLQVCVIAPERVMQMERAAFKAANSEQAESKMHTVTQTIKRFKQKPDS